MLFPVFSLIIARYYILLFWTGVGYYYYYYSRKKVPYFARFAVGKRANY